MCFKHILYILKLFLSGLFHALYTNTLARCLYMPYFHFKHKAHYFVCLDIQGVSRLVDITAGGDFLGHCDQKSSYKHVSDFGRLRSYGHFLIPIHALV